MTPEMKKIVKRIVRDGNPPRGRTRNVDHRINERAGWQDAFERNAEQGYVAICRSGMDCDCTQYADTRHMPVPVSLVAWVKGENEHQHWLDGPESTWVGKPSDYPARHASADRALEAYEDGHPSVVYWGDL
jgi:hypothetical protein